MNKVQRGPQARTGLRRGAQKEYTGSILQRRGNGRTKARMKTRALKAREEYHHPHIRKGRAKQMVKRRGLGPKGGVMSAVARTSRETARSGLRERVKAKETNGNRSRLNIGMDGTQGS